MGNGFYRSKDPTNSIKVLKEMLKKRKKTTKTTKYTYIHTDNNVDRKGYTQNKHSKSPSLHKYGVTRGQLPERAGSLGLNGGGATAAVPRTHVHVFMHALKPKADTLNTH